MPETYDAAGLLSFLDYLADKGLGKSETIKSRKIAVSRVIDTLGKDEFSDLRDIDVDQAMERFFNIEGSRYSPDSMRAYKSRVNTAISDFLRYRENPAGFRVIGQRKARAGKDARTRPPQDQQESREAHQATSTRAHQETKERTVDALELPIPIRADLIVRLVGVPFDLRRSEAQRIANVVLAMSVDDE